MSEINYKKICYEMIMSTAEGGHKELLKDFAKKVGVAEDRLPEVVLLEVAQVFLKELQP